MRGEEQLALGGSLVPGGMWGCGSSPPAVGTSRDAATPGTLSLYGNLTIYGDGTGHKQCFRYNKRDLSKALESAEMSVIA